MNHKHLNSLNINENDYYFTALNNFIVIDNTNNNDNGSESDNSIENETNYIKYPMNRLYIFVM